MILLPTLVAALLPLPAAPTPSSGTVASPAGTLVLRNARVARTLDAEERPADLRIVDGRIAELTPPGEIDAPDGAREVDLEGRWVLPGLVDAHVHFFQSGGLYTRPDAIDLRAKRPYEEELQLIRDDLDDTFRRWLRCGVTSVIDVGGPFWNFEVRRLARASELAPRVLVAGPLISTYQPPALATDDPPIVLCEDEETALALVRRQVELETDLIKIWYIVFPGRDPEEHRALARATIAESHRLGTRVAVHATQLATARISVEEGADVLVHSVEDAEVDDAFVELLLERETVYVPTLVVRGGYSRVLWGAARPDPEEAAYADPEVVATWFELERWIREGAATRRAPRPPSKANGTNLKRLFDAGVTVVAGTDAGNVGTLHGPSIFRELDAMAAAGLTPLEVVHTATVGGAAALDMADELGAVAVGRLADLAVYDADPTRDLDALRAPFAVVRGGRYTTAAELDALEPPLDAVQRLVNARRAQDMDAYHRELPIDATVELPGGSLIVGADSVRRAGWEPLGGVPDPTVDVLERRVLDEGTVVEQVERTWSGGEAVELRVRYELADGRVHFIRIRR